MRLSRRTWVAAGTENYYINILYSERFIVIAIIEDNTSYYGVDQRSPNKYTKPDQFSVLRPQKIFDERAGDSRFRTLEYFLNADRYE